MNIVILGAGSIGSYLATTLSQENHNVILIDHDPKAIERLDPSADIATRVGSGTDWKLLEEIKEFSPDFFIAMSSDDETNLVACAIAKSLGYPNTAARIRQNLFLDGGRVDFGRLFSVDHIVGTEVILAKDIFKCIINPGNLAVENFAQGGVQMRTLVIPEEFGEKGKPLAQIQLRDNFLVGLIKRKLSGDNPSIIFPKGQDLLLAGDEVTFIGETKEMQQLSQIFGLPKKNIESVVLVGGSGVAIHLAQLLEQHKIKVKFIEQDEQKCYSLARLFPSATILNHDATDLNFLLEEKIFKADAFVACTQSHETNILVSLLGKQVGCQEVIALVSDESAVPLLRSFQISYALSEKTSIARRIQVILHKDTFISLASLYNSQANIMEVKIPQGSKLAGEAIADLKNSLPENLLIAMIENENGITIPKGSTVLHPGDKAIVICGPESVHLMEKLL